MRSLALIALLLAAGLAGCTADDDDTLRIAFVQTDDDLHDDKDPQRLADRIAEATGRDVELYYVLSGSAVLQALDAGQADVAFLDGAAAWFGWQRFGLEAVAADVNSDGRTHYVAAAWVRSDSDYESMEDLRGATSCHTGRTKSAGMFMPLGWLLENNMAHLVGAADDLAAIDDTVLSFFGDAIIPESGAPYSGYNGALQCLSEGVGDVAFVKDTTPESYCAEAAEDWCLALDDYRLIQEFGTVPSHPVMVRPGLDDEAVSDLVAALEGLSDDAEGQAILEEILESAGVVPVTTEAHLGSYGQNLQHIPGIQQYVEDQLA